MIQNTVRQRLITVPAFLFNQLKITFCIENCFNTKINLNQIVHKKIKILLNGKAAKDSQPYQIARLACAKTTFSNTV